MEKTGTLGWFYRLANTLILGGFAMLCQPFTHDLFVAGFPVLLSGVILFMVLDHVPDNQSAQSASAQTSSGQS